MSAEYKWADLWAAIETMSPQTQFALYHQLDLETWLNGKASEVQVEVLKYAPEMIVKSLSNILKPEAKRKLCH